LQEKHTGLGQAFGPVFFFADAWVVAWVVVFSHCFSLYFFGALFDSDPIIFYFKTKREGAGLWTMSKWKNL